MALCSPVTAVVLGAAWAALNLSVLAGVAAGQPAEGLSEARSERPVGILDVAAERIGQGSLRGLCGVHVVVENLGDGAASLGLTERGIRTQVEQLLRGAGVPVLQTFPPCAARPYLYVSVNLLVRAEGKSATASVSIELNQRATLKSGVEAYTATWRTGVLAQGGATYIRGLIGSLVMAFADDWIKENGLAPVGPER
jgi:hypothetical protein